MSPGDRVRVKTYLPDTLCLLIGRCGTVVSRWSMYVHVVLDLREDDPRDKPPSDWAFLECELEVLS